MDVRILKIADACAVSGYTRDQMRGLLRDLPPFTVDQGSGKHRTFTRVELLAIVIVSTMEQRYGIKRSAIGGIIDPLLSAIQAPRSIDPLACLVIVTSEGTVTYTNLSENLEEGLLIPLGPIFDLLDTYLGAKTTEPQLEISFGPGVIRKRTG